MEHSPRNPTTSLDLYDANDDGVIDADELITAALDHLNGHIDKDLLLRVYNLYLAGYSSAGTAQSEDSASIVHPCVAYDTNADGVERDEVITAIGDYVFDGTITRDTVTQVIGCFVFQSSPPPAPAGLSQSASDKNRDSISLTWNTMTDVYSYKVERREGYSGPWTVLSTTNTSTEYTAPGLSCGKAYGFRVSARGDGHTYSTAFGPTSKILSTSTSECRSAPPPKGLSVDAVTHSSVSLTWTAVTGAIEYKVEWGNSSTTTSFASYTVSNLRCETTYQFQVRARGDGYPFSKDYGAPAVVSGTASDCPPPAPTGLTSTAHGTGKIVLDWNDVSGGDVTYEVQQWDRVFLVIYEWKTLPFDGFEIEFSGSSALISGLDYDHTYDHRVRAKQDDWYSEWTDRFKTKVPLPHFGHQADHTVKYLLGAMPSDVIPTAVSMAAKAWNDAAATPQPHVLFCGDADCQDRNTDGRTVGISANAEDKCGTIAIACFTRRFGDVHLDDLKIYIEEPAYAVICCDEYGPYRQRFIWTNEVRLHGVKNVAGEYAYLPAPVMHEFGHAAGLEDLRDFGKYSGYLMYDAESQTTIPKKDRDCLREVYRNHDRHPISAP